MAIGISFDKAKAKVFLDCLANGKPVPPQDPRGWTVYDMLALAGACYFAGMSHGPALYQNTDWSKVPGGAARGDRGDTLRRPARRDRVVRTGDDDGAGRRVR